MRLPAVLLLGGATAIGAAPSAGSSQEAGPTLTMSLLPDAGTFDRERVRRGAVGFTARIRNEGQAPVVIAHPTLCFPAEYTPGETLHREEWHGRSEILLTIERPDGRRVVLRDGFFGFFDPGNRDRLVIRPGGTGSFHLGWFFPNARGKWENDARAWTVFAEGGTYTVSVLLRNAFSRAWIRDDTGRPTFVEVWTGELESGEVMITIEPAGP